MSQGHAQEVREGRRRPVYLKKVEAWSYSQVNWDPGVGIRQSR
jgi:hypothetical protein